MKITTSLFVAVLPFTFALACGGGGEKPVVKSPESATTASTAEPAGFLVIKETVFSDGSTKTITLRADGGIEADGKVVAMLHTDGRLEKTGGPVVATMSADGKVKLGDAPGDEATIDVDGTVHLKDKVVKLNADGTIEGDKTSSKITVEPAGRRAAMFVMLMLVTTKSPAVPPT